MNSSPVRRWQTFWPVLIFVFIAIFLSFRTQRNANWKDLYAEYGPVISDGAGYYAYLPQWFIYKTSHFEFLDSIGTKYSPRFKLNPTEVNQLGQQVNKYYPGTAIALTPFFLTGHLHAHMIGEDADGYSWPYLFWITIGVLFYVLLGCLGIYRFLRNLGFSRFSSCAVVLAVALGTNLCFYTTHSIPFAHPFGMAGMAWLLVGLQNLQRNRKFHLFPLLAILFALLVITRPTNALILVFVPFLWSSGSEFRNSIHQLISKKLGYAIAGFVACAVVLAFQLYIVHAQTGRWSFNSYAREGFTNFRHPHILDVLLSYKKGLFVYTPVLLLLIPGAILLFRRHRRLFYGFILLFTVITYVFASWWNWWYGGGLGARVFIDFFPVLFLPIALMLDAGRIIWRIITLLALVCACWIYQVYENQMRLHILHYEHISEEQFWKVFLREDRRYSWYMYFPDETMPQNARAIGQADVISVSVFDSKKGKPLGPKTLPLRSFSDSLALQIRSDIQLRDPSTNPCFEFQFFRDGRAVKTHRRYVGYEVSKAGLWQTVSVTAVPGITGEQFDSLTIQFLYGTDPVLLRNATVTAFGF